jgi:uncharacterized protein
MRKRGVYHYLFLTFAIGWALWLVPLFMGKPLTGGVGRLIALPVSFAPAIAAYIVRKRITREGFSDSGLNPYSRRWYLYLFAWPFPVFAIFCVVGAASSFGFGGMNFSAMKGVQKLVEGTGSVVPEMSMGTLVFTLLLSCTFLIPLTFGEEFGWRGFLQRRLVPSKPLLSCVATGAICALWYLPLYFQQGAFPRHAGAGILVFSLTTIMLSIIWGWIFLRSGTVWASSLAHSAYNALGETLTLIIFSDTSGWIYTSSSGLLAWIPLGCTCAAIILMGGFSKEKPLPQGRGSVIP